MNQAVPLARAGGPLVLRWLLWGVPLLLVVLAFVPDRKSPGIHWEGLVVGLGLSVLFGLAPRRLAYTLTPEALVIHRLLGQTMLPCAGLRARRTQGRLRLRTFGTGLPGYLTGHFTFGPDPVPRVLAAASRGDHGVIVGSGGAAYFLTPASPDAFLRALEQRGAVVLA